jgi:hypothetical protein
MDEAALRQLVREAVSRHLQQDGGAASASAPWKTHASHVRFELAPTSDGACIVEPAVRCTHCGYCQSMGH